MNNNIDPKKISGLLNAVSKKIGVPPEKLRSELEEGKFDSALSAMNKNDAAKFQQAVNNPKLVEKMMSTPSELAQMLVSEDGSASDTDNAEKQSDEQPDLGAVLKLTSLVGAVSNDSKNTDLLRALKPHLSADKQKRVDKAIKLMKLLAMWNIAKDSGLLQELI